MTWPPSKGAPAAEEAALFRIVACVHEHHNLWLVLLAAFICVAASGGAFFVLGGLATSKQSRRWRFLAGLLAGGGTWATHFVAMLGYDPGLPVRFHLGLTLLSALLCIVGAWAAFEILARNRRPVGFGAAGVVLGLAIVAMHYVGMAGVEAAARRIWAVDLVISSAIFSIGFSTAALWAFAHAPLQYRGYLATALLVVAIVSLHFTGMGALTLMPDPRIVIPEMDLDRSLLAMTIAVCMTAALLVGVILALADRRVTATELAAAKDAARQALHDALTGLPNRRHLFETLAERLDRAKGTKFAVVAADLDRFKPINDLYGHAAGDQLLIKVARYFTDGAGADGFVARLGGDEFVLLLPYSAADDLIAKLSAIVAQFNNPLQLGAHQASVGATLGVAIYPVDGDDADLLMRRADVALYRAKDDGRGRFAFFEAGMDARVQERAALERDLRIAIRNDEIIPHFQPLVHLQTGAVNGYEILARWNHPTRGLVEPSHFIQIAGETGMIGELTLNILRRACREALNWPGAPRLSLNIAPAQLRDTSLPQQILSVLAECGFPPARMEVEITEDALVSDFEMAKAILTSFKNLGIRVALDDFGTGYSSLRHLRELPFDALKIDRSFVNSMNDSAEALSIVKTIVQLARNLGLGVTAEGIETALQAQELQALGCDRGQGFYLGRPAAGSAEEPAEAPPAQKSA
jgi:diguanylate cyclase (GGDEF)-like protein